MEYFVFKHLAIFCRMLTSCFVVVRIAKVKTEGEKKNTGRVFGGKYGWICFAAAATALFIFLQQEIRTSEWIFAMIAVLLYGILYGAGFECVLVWVLIDGVVRILGKENILSDSWIQAAQAVCGQLFCFALKMWTNNSISSSEIRSLICKVFTHKILKKAKGRYILCTAGIVALYAFGYCSNMQPYDFFNILISILLFSINIAVSEITDYVSELREARKKAEEKQKAMQLLLKNQEDIQALYQEMRSFRHDISSHLYAVSGLIQLGEIHRAEEYIKKISGKIKLDELVLSGNPFFDALIGSKNAAARQEGIDVYASISVKAVLYIEEVDLISLLGNLYDNAIEANTRKSKEACEKNSVDKSWIRVKIMLNASDLLIVFQNTSFHVNGADNKSIWKSTKNDAREHGIGLQNIDSIVKKYEGYGDRKMQDGIFEYKARIPNKAIEK